MKGKAAGAGVGTAVADAGPAEGEEGTGTGTGTGGGGAGFGGTLALCGLDAALLVPSLWSLSTAIVSRTCLSLSTDADFGNTKWVSA